METKPSKPFIYFRLHPIILFFKTNYHLLEYLLFKKKVQFFLCVCLQSCSNPALSISWF